jgi:hypothetical protein
MSESIQFETLIKSITTKSKWQEKIIDKKIVNNWIKELTDKNFDKTKVETSITLLKKVRKYFGKNQNLKNYDWFELNNLSFHIEEIDDDYNNYLLQKEEEERLKAFNIAVRIEIGKKHYKTIDINYDQYKKLILKDCITGEESILVESNPEKNEINKVLELQKGNSFFNKYVSTSTSLISNALKNEFLEILSKVEATDIHPWSQNQVYNYFHPSLFPYIKGYSKISKCFNRRIDDKMLFQWLATDVKVEYKGVNDVEDISVTFLSDINNCPSVELYKPIGKILSKFIPLFNNLITTLIKNQIIHYRHLKYTSLKFKDLEDFHKELDEEPIKLNNCQFIIKAQKIFLNKNDNAHKEGSLHLEGTCYERILATGIYYFNVKNVNETKLKLHAKIHAPKEGDYYSYLGGDYIKIYHPINDIPTSEDLCIVFPNFLYHKVEELHLLDKNNIGCREILVFWLVDPNIKILSTANVFPLKNKMGIEEANLFRELLMYERKYIKNQSLDKDIDLENQQYVNNTTKMKYRDDSDSDSDSDYNLCEH